MKLLHKVYGVSILSLVLFVSCGRSFQQKTTNPIGIPMQTRIIDSGTGIGIYPSLGYSSAGVPYASYQDSSSGTLKIGWLDITGLWDNVDVAGGNGYVNAGAFGSMDIANDTYYISYYDPLIHGLEMVSGALPVVEAPLSPPVITLDKPTNTTYATGVYTSLKVGPGGTVNISYMDILGQDPVSISAAYPRYVSWTPSGPSAPEVVDPSIEGRVLATPLRSIPCSTSIAVAKDGTVWIAYYDVFDKALKIAEKSGTTWTVQTVDNSGGGEGDGEYQSLVLDSKGYPHLSYTEDTGIATEALKYAWYDGNSFHTEDVDRESGVHFGPNSMVLNPSSEPVIAYFDETFNDLKIAFMNNGEWYTYVLDTALLSGEYPSMALAPTGVPTVAYRQYAPGFDRITLKFGIVDYNNL